MLINVPQYIDVEDKVAGPLTAKQLFWYVALGIILIILWNVLPKSLAIIIGIPLALIFSAFAFYKPYGQPLASFLMYGILYFFKPKVYMWRRMPEKDIKIISKVEDNSAHFEDKKISSEKLKEIAELLDSEGTNYNDDVVDILKKPVKK